MSNSALRVADTAPTPLKRPEGLAAINGDLLKGVQVSLEAKLGRTDLSIEQILALKPGSVVALETGLGETVDLCLNEAVVARCEIVAVGDKFGLRIVEIAAA